jgi:N-succinyldiaminopimelate aminotransferase
MLRRHLFRHPPATALLTRLRKRGGFSRLLTFHSLSKRSGLPGLRSGWWRAMPPADREIPRLPQCRGRRCRRRSWRRRRRLARRSPCRGQPRRLSPKDGGGERHPGQPHGIPLPEGGFFLWLDVGNGEEFGAEGCGAKGVRVLPGAYMGREIEPGKTQSNPGFSYIRVALVHDLSTIMTALERMGKFSSCRRRA